MELAPGARGLATFASHASSLRKQKGPDAGGGESSRSGPRFVSLALDQCESSCTLGSLLPSSRRAALCFSVRRMCSVSCTWTTRPPPSTSSTICPGVFLCRNSRIRRTTCSGRSFIPTIALNVCCTHGSRPSALPCRGRPEPDRGSLSPRFAKTSPRPRTGRDSRHRGGARRRPRRERC